MAKTRLHNLKLIAESLLLEKMKRLRKELDSFIEFLRTYKHLTTRLTCATLTFISLANESLLFLMLSQWLGGVTVKAKS